MISALAKNSPRPTQEVIQGQAVRALAAVCMKAEAEATLASRLQELIQGQMSKFGKTE